MQSIVIKTSMRLFNESKKAFLLEQKGFNRSRTKGVLSGSSPSGVAG